ncbi:MAG: hypothetical protein JNG83_05635 [Opitutaceae bacterium]|nr:hypothetical protein [Opitutaceae bacterium]
MPSPPCSRREFAGLAAVGALALGAGVARAAATSAPAAATRRGIWKIIRRPRALEAPLDAPAGETWRYLLSYPFQVGPNTAALYLNLKQYLFQAQDFESGLDVVTFDRLEDIRADRAVAVCRKEIAPNPNNGGLPALINKYPGQLGFVPFGAKRADGQPHPHAGTGFALVATAARPLDHSEGFATMPDRIGIPLYRGAKQHLTLELYQLRYDGTRFTVGPREVLLGPDLLPSSGYTFENGGMGCAIADGDDLIAGMKGKPRDGKADACGLMRWRRTGGAWRPAAFTAITPEDDSLEPTLVRDVDGGLLMHVRARRHLGPPIRVWRQPAAGQPWQQCIHLNRMIPSTPVTINRAADGTPFLACNLYQPEFKLPAGLVSDGGISRLEPVGWRGERSTLCVMPLNEARDGFDAQFIARDPRTEFGLPPHGTVWAVDHGTASPLRLADGQWRCFMGYRLLEWKENTHFIPPSPQTGTYLDEVVSFGTPAPLWNF